MNTQHVFERHEQFQQVIDSISKRFTSYGYQRITTAAFQNYNLYNNVNRSINQNEMIKVIDFTGEVLVLRPDVTIPITLELANTIETLSEELRFYYIQEVFRQSFERDKNIGRTQAGVEYFCETSPQADAEVIALACHVLKDLGLKDIKIEIGNEAFFSLLVKDLAVSKSELNQLKELIQSKNVAELTPYLETLPIDESVSEVIQLLPLLYGNPDEVFAKVEEVNFSIETEMVIKHIKKVVSLLKIYELGKHLTIDLGLINHMDYYSGIIFQGYVSQFGKPVLMGGRYDRLGDVFGTKLPAIGFACEIESIVQALDSRGFCPTSPEMFVIFNEEHTTDAIQLTTLLRNNGYNVRSCKKRYDWIDMNNKNVIIEFSPLMNVIINDSKRVPFTENEQVINYIRETKESRQ